MKKSWLVGIVVAAHGVAAALVLLIQGCGTTTVTTQPPEPVMPGAGPIETVEPIHMPAPAKPVMPIVRPEPRPYPATTTSYTIQKGDSLSVIAKRYNVSLAELMALNRIADANKIFAGQKLVLPGKVDLSAPVVKPVKPAAAADGANSYVVKPGDSLSVIAARFGTTVQAIKDANGMSGDKILVDQKLVMPAGKPAAAVQAVQAAQAAPSAPKPAAAAKPAEEARVQGSAAPASEIPSSSIHTYKVQENEDLYSVSLMWDVTVEDLQRLNNLSGTDLVPGTELKIPLAE